MAKETKIGFVIGAKDRASKVFSKFGGTVIAMNQGLALAQRAFYGLQRAVEAAIDPMVEFQNEMANINTLLDVSERQFAQLEQGILSIARTTPKAMTDLTKGAYDLISAGVAQENVLWALNKAQMAAVAGSTDIKVAVAGSMATINAYNLGMSEMERVLDLEFSTVKYGVLTFDQLAVSIGRVMPAGKKLGATLEEIHAGMALITKAGFTADEAATILDRTLSSLADPNKQENFRELGIAIYDQNEQFVGMADLLKQINALTGTMTQKQRAEFEGLIGLEMRASKGFARMVDNAEEYKNMVDEFGESTGAMGDAHEIMAETIKNQWGTIKNAVHVAIVEWGMNHERLITNIVQSIQLIVDNLPLIETTAGETFKAVYNAGRIAFNALTIIANAFWMLLVGLARMFAVMANQIPGIRGDLEEFINFTEFAMGELNENIKKDWDDITEATGRMSEAIENNIEQEKHFQELINNIKGIFAGTYHVVEDMNAELTVTDKKIKEIKKDSKDLGEELSWAQEHAKQLGMIIGGPMASGMGAVVHGMIMGRAAFESVADFAKQIVAQLMAAVVQATALAAIMATIKGGGFLGFFGGLLGFHRGGTIPKAHSGLYMPDERLILAQTGESVLTRQATRAIGGRQTIDYINTYNALPPTSTSRSSLNINFYGDVINEDIMIERIEQAVELGKSNISITREPTDVEY